MRLIDSRSYRRKLLDEALSNHAHLMRGTVVDLAGKNNRVRGKFRPPVDQITERIVVNLDPAAEPDLVADIRDTTLPDEKADCVVLTETLQHVPDPERCIQEATRILKPGGVFIGSIPFLYPVHRDPEDLMRFGPDGLRAALADFSEIDILAMGGFWGVLGLMLERKVLTVSLTPILNKLALVKMSKAGLLVGGKFLTALDRKRLYTNTANTLFTTGYFFVAKK